jgi:hypothetical protein
MQNLLVSLILSAYFSAKIPTLTMQKTLRIFCDLSLTMTLISDFTEHRVQALDLEKHRLNLRIKLSEW